MKNYIKLAISIVSPLLVGFLSSFYTRDGISSWYVSINKPTFTPPDWVFGPVWTLLYLMMGIFCYFVWVNKSKNKNVVLSVYWVQLVLNGLWSVFFFGMQNPKLAFVDIILLLVAIILTMITSFKISNKLIYLLAPYLAWVSFATVLNFFMMILN